MVSRCAQGTRASSELQSQVNIFSWCLRAEPCVGCKVSTHWQAADTWCCIHHLWRQNQLFSAQSWGCCCCWAVALSSSRCLITPVFCLTGGSATFPISQTFLLPGSSKPASTPFSISSDITQRPGEEVSPIFICYTFVFVARSK